MFLPLLPPLLLPVYFHLASMHAARPAIAMPAVETHWMIERQASERWMHARQRPAFTRPIASHVWWPVRVRDEADGGRTLTLTSSNRMLGDAQLRVDAAGRVRATEILPLPVRPPAQPFPLFMQSPRDSMRMAESALFTGFNSGTLSMPESHLWELLPVFAPRAARTRARWTDTLKLEAVQGAYRQQLTGIRQSMITGDTTMNGHHLWVVRHSAVVQYRERWLDRERTLDSAAVVERVTAGTINGRYLYDDSLRLARASWDTTALRGTASLSYADGRTFPTTARFERTRALTLFDSTGYRAREQARRAAAPQFNIVRRPEGRLEERLASGDSVLRDSLERVWKAARDPLVRDSLFGAITGWGATRATSDRLLRAALVAGDTIRFLNTLERLVWGGKLDVASLTFALPFMDSPGLMFAFGRARDVFYENFGGGMMNKPPALMPDTASWPCEPAACRLLADQWTKAREPRLRDVALLTHFAMDPKRWKDTMEAHAVRGGVAASALYLLRGIGAPWAASSKRPMPPVGALWPAWIEWMSGTNPKFALPVGGPPRSSEIANRVRFDDSHKYSILMQELLTGRDIAGELARGYASGEDTARFVFGAMLLALDKLTLDPAQIAQAFEGPEGSLDRALATRAVTTSFRHASRADAALTTALTDTLLAMLIDGAPPWRSLENAPNQRSAVTRLSDGKTPVVVLSEQFPEVLTARWAGRVKLLTDVRYRVPKEQYPTLLVTLLPIEVTGSLARVSVNLLRDGDRPEARGFRIYLMRTEAGWVIVASDGWIA